MSGAPPSIDIRRTVPGDERDLARIHVDAWSDAYRGLLPDDVIDGQTTERRTRQWERTIASDTMASWIASVAGRPAGLMSVGPSDVGHVGEVFTIYVTAPYWGRGVGSRLWDAGISHLETTGFSSACLWVLDSNDRARAFYAHKGWVPDGETRLDDTFGRAISEIRYASPALQERGL